MATALYNDQGAAPWPANGWMLTAKKTSGGGGGGRGSGLPSGLLPAPAGATALQETGLQPAALNSGRLIENLFPEIQSIGGVRPDSLPFHPSGRALDVMIPQYQSAQGKALGDQIMSFFQQNADALGVEDTIWQDFWQPTNGSPGKKLGRAGDTEGHRNHVHITFGDKAGFDNASVAGAGGYDGPGQNRNSPMYVESAKDSGGAQLGKDIVSGFMDILGFGDLFKDPTQFGLFKIFKGLMGVKVGDQTQGQGQDQGGGLGGLLGGSGSGGGGLLDSLMGIIPQPFGALNSGSPEDAPGEFIPGISDGGHGAAASTILGGLVPQPKTEAGKSAQRIYDQSVHLEGSHFGYSQTAVKDGIQEGHLQAARPRLRPLP
ncbi:hypothetical protein ACVWWN_004379 [Mycobacterium sp. URHB0021]